MSVFQSALIKIGSLVSFCGGPLILSDMLKPRIGTPAAFAATFVPILLLIFGADSLFYPKPRRPGLSRGSPERTDSIDMPGWGIFTVRAGLVGAFVILLMHGYGIWILATTPPRPDQGLNVFGIVVGFPLAGVYAYAARRWLSHVEGPLDISSPIEPS